jgi:hypothetical protein
MPWVSPTRIYSGSFGPNTVWIIEFTTGNVSTTTSLVRIGGAEFTGPPSGRRWCLSSVAGDLTVGLGQPGDKGDGGPSAGTSFATGSGSGLGYYPVLALNTTYYLNIGNNPTTYPDVPMFCDLANVP